MKSLEELKAIRERMQNQVNLRESGGQTATRVVVGMATCGIASGARPVLTALLQPGAGKGPDGKSDRDPDRLHRPLPVRAHRGSDGTRQGKDYLY